MAYMLEKVKFSPFKDAKRLRITSNYGNRTITINGKTDSSFHNGIDMNNWECNDVVAFADGVVTDLINTRDGHTNNCGNYVTINHDLGYSVYYHLKKGSICVKKGQQVKQNEKIGVKGNTGYSTAAHLHFGIKINNKWVEPKPYLLGEKLINNAVVSLPKPLSANNLTDQIEVLIDNLRVRTSPRIISDNILGFVPKGYYNILNTFVDDKYNWYEIEKGRWVANNGSYLKVYKKLVEEPKIEESIISENEPILEQKEEDSPNTLDEHKKDDKLNEISEYYDKKENPLLWLIDIIINLINKLFKKG